MDILSTKNVLRSRTDDDKLTTSSERTNGDLSIRWIRHGDTNQMNSDFDGFSMRRVLAIHSLTEAMHLTITAIRAAEFDGRQQSK